MWWDAGLASPGLSEFPWCCRHCAQCCVLRCGGGGVHAHPSAACTLSHCCGTRKELLRATCLLPFLRPLLQEQRQSHRKDWRYRHGWGPLNVSPRIPGELLDRSSLFLFTSWHNYEATSLSFTHSVRVSEWNLLNRVWLSATPWTIACQAPLSMKFSRQESWSG